MRAPGIVRRHPELGWLVSLGLIVAVGAVVVTTVSGVFRDDAALPTTSPDQVVAQIRTPHVGGYFGAISSHLDLGLPSTLTQRLERAVPDAGALPPGTHQLKYWYGDATRQRIAVLETQGREQDLFRDGDQLLFWDTGNRTARRTTLAASVPTPTLTPPQLAVQLLSMISSAADSDDITLRSGAQVAGEPTYELDVRPDASASRIGEVRIQVDGRHLVPLGVQVYSRGSTDPAIDVSFTSIDYAAPSSRNFTFSPPAGSRTDTSALPALTTAPGRASTSGAGWSRRVVYTATPAVVAAIEATLAGRLRVVSGSWGKGRLLETPLLCVLFMSKGRIVAGAVDPSALYASAG